MALSQVKISVNKSKIPVEWFSNKKKVSSCSISNGNGVVGYIKDVLWSIPC